MRAMDLGPTLRALVWHSIVKQTRNLPTALPTNREEYLALQLGVGYAYLAEGVGAADVEVQQFLEWYQLHEKEIVALGERFLAAADADSAS